MLTELVVDAQIGLLSRTNSFALTRLRSSERALTRGARTGLQEETTARNEPPLPFRARENISGGECDQICILESVKTKRRRRGGYGLCV